MNLNTSWVYLGESLTVLMITVFKRLKRLLSNKMKHFTQEPANILDRLIDVCGYLQQNYTGEWENEFLKYECAYLELKLQLGF